jgi:hypothetical protein
LAIDLLARLTVEFYNLTVVPQAVKPDAQLFKVEANAVPNAKSRQFAALHKPVDSGATEPQQPRYFGHPK